MLAVLVSGCLTACGAQGGSSESVPVDGGRVSPRLVASFALMAAPADGLPPGVEDTLNVPVKGLRWSLARRVPVTVPGRYWLVPGAKDVCIVGTTPHSPAVGTVCATVDQALRHGIANTSLNPSAERRLIVGVAPRGTRTVIIESRTATARVPVRHGTFVLRDSVTSPPDRLTLR